jgi:glycosyltransferase involved in cell wall biosynthesis
MYFSIIVPVYNNNNTLQKVLQHIQRNFSGLQHQYEIVFVNDGSVDESLQTLLRLRDHYDNIAVVSLSKNYNQATAVVAGFAHAEGD